MNIQMSIPVKSCDFVLQQSYGEAPVNRIFFPEKFTQVKGSVLHIVASMATEGRFYIPNVL